jgi:hypothetical protein
MERFDSMRGNFLRASSLGVAGAGVSTTSPATTATQHGARGAFSLHDVKDLRIGWSRAAPDTVLKNVEAMVV